MFGPIVLFFGFFGLLVVLFLRLIIRLLLKGRKSSWSGELVDKLHQVIEDDNDMEMDYYALVFKTTEGKEVKVGTTKTIWDTYKIGDKAIKKSGTFKPEKIS